MEVLLRCNLSIKNSAEINDSDYFKVNGPEIIVSIFLSLKNVVTSSSEGNTLVASFLLLTFNANDLQSSCLRNHKVKTVFQGQFQCCQRKFALNFHAKNDIKNEGYKC